MPLWWRRFDTCREMGWTPAEYDTTPMCRLVEIEEAIVIDRRHRNAMQQQQQGT